MSELEQVQVYDMYSTDSEISEDIIFSGENGLAFKSQNIEGTLFFGENGLSAKSLNFVNNNLFSGEKWSDTNSEEKRLSIKSLNLEDNNSLLHKIKDKLAIILCTIIIIVAGSAQAILLPLCTLYIQSGYFILFSSVIEINIIFSVIMLIYYFYLDDTIFRLKRRVIFIVIAAGICQYLTCLIQAYASDPSRTAPIMQSTVNATTLIFSVLFGTIFLKKDVSYNLKFVIVSVTAIVISVLLPLIYELTTIGLNTQIAWTCGYAFGTSLKGANIVLQEKYFITMNNTNDDNTNDDNTHEDDENTDDSIGNKLRLLFYTNLIQIPLVIPSIGFDFVFNNATNVTTELLDGPKVLFTNYRVFLLFHGFILAYFVFLGSAMWLNKISSNYVSVTNVVIGPTVTIFFQSFKNLTSDIVYPLYIVIPRLILSICGNLLWIFGEN